MYLEFRTFTTLVLVEGDIIILSLISKGTFFRVMRSHISICSQVKQLVRAPGNFTSSVVGYNSQF